MVSRRRYADHTWDFIQDDDAPMPKRVRCEDDLIITKDSTIFGDLHVRPDFEMDMDLNCNQYPKNPKGNDVPEKEEAHICSDPATDAEHSKITEKVEQRADNMVQVFPQAVPIYEHRQPINHFSYCDRSAFSRHLFF